MENKDAKLIRKFITLAESIQPNTEEIHNEEEIQNIEVNETEEQPIDEQVKMFQDAIKTLARAAGEEKALWQTIKQEIPALGNEYKTLKDFQLAAEAGKIGATQSAELVKFAIKNSPELAMKMKGLLRSQPEFAEIAKQVFPKGTLNPADPRKMEIAKKTLSQMGIEGKEAEQMLQKAAQEAGGTGGVSKKAIDKAISKRAKDMKGASAEVKAVETNVKSGGEAAAQVQKTIGEKGAELAARWKDKFQKASEYLKKYTPNMFEKLKGIKSKLNWKSLVLYGLAGWGTIEILKSLFGEDEKGGAMPDCVVNLEGMEWGATSKGDAMIYTKNEFDAKSKGHGGLKFYPNGRVWTMDNAMSGSYACKSGKLQVSEEEVTEQASNITITWDEKGSTPVPVKTDDTTTPPKKDTTISYTECKGFPLTYGCKGEEIKKLQVCLGMEAKYQTGNFGPKTMDALSNRIKQDMNPQGQVGVHGGHVVVINKIRTEGISKEIYDTIIKKCEGGQGGSTATTTSTTATPTATTTTPTATAGATATAAGSTATTQTTESPADLYARLVKDKTLVGRLNGRRIVYKGPDLTKEDREKLEAHLNKMGYRVSRSNFDYRKGDKMVFKRNKEEGTTEPKGLTQEPTK